MNDIIDRLIEQRNKKINAIKLYEEKLIVLNEEIKQINEKICNVEGHSYNDWQLIQHTTLDRKCYLERTCEVCGNVERNFNYGNLNSYLKLKHSTK